MYNIPTDLLGVITCLLSFFSTYIIFDFMSKFGRCIYKEKYLYICSYFLFTFILIAAGMFFPNLIVNILICLVGTVIIGHFLYNDDKMYILYYSLLIVAMTAFQIVISFIFNFISGIGILNFYTIDSYIFANSIVIQFANLSATRMFLNKYKNKEITKLSKVEFSNFLLLPIFSIFYIITLTMYSDIFLTFQDTFLFGINIASIIGLNIFITNIFQSISKNNEMKNKINLYEQQANMSFDYYNSLETKYKNSRKVIHDIKNHLQTIENLYKENEVNKAKDYTEDLDNIFKGLEHRHYCDNRVLNIIINEKSEKASSINILIDSKIGDVNLDGIRDIDLTTIFSNLLDNAIDEVKNFEIDRVIFLKVSSFNDFIVINVSNALRSKPIKNKDDFKSTKKDHQGLGLQNVRLA
ncbi:MAG: sensor histidine kinase, partial [Clostridium sp.]